MERVDDALDAWVVRCNTIADETVRGRERVEEIYGYVLVGVSQDVSGVDSCWTSAKNGDA
jgi:hypothetical protein